MILRRGEEQKRGVKAGKGCEVEHEKRKRISIDLHRRKQRDGMCV